MATATVTPGALASARREARPARRGRRVVTWLLVVLGLLVVWEGLKFVGGTPWRAPLAAPGAPVLWNPPFRWPFANDLNLPHVWKILLTFGQPFQRGAEQTWPNTCSGRLCTPGGRRSSGSPSERGSGSSWRPSS